MDGKKYHNEVQRILAREADPALKALLGRIAEQVAAGLAAGKSATAAIDEAIAAAGLDDEVGSITRRCMLQAACAGYGISPAVVASSGAMMGGLALAWTADGLKLSSRLHGVGQAIRQAIASELNAAQADNAAWRQAAKYLYDGYGAKTVLAKAELPAYLDKLHQAAKKALVSGQLDRKAVAEYEKELKQARRLLDKLNAGGTTAPLKAGYAKLLLSTQKLTEKRLQNAVYTACEERARYYAERIARTESARAWFDGFLAKYGSDPDVAGYRWTLGSRHPCCDVCDLHAHADFYGMGAGVYPKNSVPPLPAHPHCLCSLLPVYAGETTRGGRFDSGAGEEYLKSASLSTRQALLGVKGEEAWRQGREVWTDLAKKRGWQEPVKPLARLKPEDFAEQLSRSRNHVTMNPMRAFKKIGAMPNKVFSVLRDSYQIQDDGIHISRDTIDHIIAEHPEFDEAKIPNIIQDLVDNAIIVQRNNRDDTVRIIAKNDHLSEPVGRLPEDAYLYLIMRLSNNHEVNFVKSLHPRTKLKKGELLWPKSKE